MSETILTITAENFEKEVLQSALPVLVDFWAPWCVYCRRIEPAVEELAEDTEGKLVVGKVNVDEQEALAEEYKVEVIPTLMIFKDGKMLGSIVAPDSKAKIEAFIAEHLK